MTGNKHGSRGFTLIASLLLLLLLSAIAIGMLMMVNTEGKVGTQDLENNTTFHSAEGAIEKMTSDLSSTFQNIESPTVSQIEGLSALAPAPVGGVNYPVYSLIPATNPDGSLAASFGQIASGPNQGLYAQLLPITLQATAQGPLGDEVNMSRTVEVALIPVFQFGIYSDSDLSFFAGVNLTFGGRVHTNGDLYLAAGNGVATTFQDKVTAWGNIIRTQLPNGLTNAATSHQGTINILTASQGCSGGQPACRAMAATEGSVVGGPNSAYNSGPPSWQTISLTDYNGWAIDGDYGNTLKGTGATKLSLPFVNGVNGAANGPQSFEIIRRPPPGELPTSLLGAARLYNEAAVRVLLSDTPNDLPGGAADPQNIRLANGQFAGGPNYTTGVPTAVPAGTPALGAGHAYTTYFATATTAMPEPALYTGSYLQTRLSPSGDWRNQPAPAPAGAVTLYDANAPLITPVSDVIGLTIDPNTENQWNLSAVCNPSSPVSVPPAAGPPVCPGVSAYPYYSPVVWGNSTTPSPTQASPPTASSWNLLDGYLRVEYRDVNGVYHPVTQEWLGLGFARGTLPPTGPLTNPVNPDAILILQEPADRNGDGVIDIAGIPPGYTISRTVNHGVTTTTYTPYPGKPPEATVDSATNSAWWGDSTAPNGTQGPSMYNWYPINFYDAREGEPRDVVQAGTSCTPNGVMNAVEIDVGNLQQWLSGAIGTSGRSVDYISQNGYVLYFSDRRGMLPNPNGTQVDAANTKTGDSGLEDSVNAATVNGTPDGVLEPIPAGKTESPEDVNNNGRLDNFGALNLGLGLGPAGGLAPYTVANNVNRVVNAAGAPDPYLVGNRIASCSVAQANWVSGARHVLKLVDGGLGNLPIRPDNGLGGFTVGSENPVYVYGNYNTNAGDPIWNGGNDVAHAESGIVADAVTMLSNSWSDLTSLGSPSNDAGRNATTTYYRVAISAGKNINFPSPGYAPVGDFGTDGGLHNFLRQLENWGGQGLFYDGSMVSMYYSTYATGTDKNGGGTVYEPPSRNYSFDSDFTQPQNLPPGTPMFRDIDNLSYRQNFVAHTGSF